MERKLGRNRGRLRRALAGVAPAAALALWSCTNSGAVDPGAGPVVPNATAGQRQTGWRGTTPPASRIHAGPSSPIQHVVLVVQENRSFDNLFQGYPGANTASSGYTRQGQLVTLQPLTLANAYDMLHQFNNALTDMDGGKMDGFDSESPIGCSKKCNPLQAYTYVQQSDVQTYFNMAGQYVLADNFFPSDEDGSFVSHQYLIAAQANDTFGLPFGVPPADKPAWGCDGIGKVHTLNPNTIPGTPKAKAIADCFDPYSTLADEIDAAPPLTWRYYAAAKPNTGYIWLAFDTVSHIRNGPEWSTNVVQSPQQFISDVQGGTLANVTWITPPLAKSDHPGSLSKAGPAWVASVVNAVGTSKFWDSTAIFILWDDWGGWYDHVPPPVLDFDGLGVRTPLLVVSPYALPNTVAHTQYEFGSLLGFIEQNFGLAALSASDARANPLAGGDVFNFSQSPRPFSKF